MIAGKPYRRTGINGQITVPAKVTGPQCLGAGKHSIPIACHWRWLAEHYVYRPIANCRRAIVFYQDIQLVAGSPHGSRGDSTAYACHYMIAARQHKYAGEQFC